MPIPTDCFRQAGPLVTVRSIDDIEFLVKESEILTGRRGRKFVITGATRLVFRVHWYPTGYQVRRLNSDTDKPCHRKLFMRPYVFFLHRLGRALRTGRLCTPEVCMEAGPIGSLATATAPTRRP